MKLFNKMLSILLVVLMVLPFVPTRVIADSGGYPTEPEMDWFDNPGMSPDSRVENKVKYITATIAGVGGYYVRIDKDSGAVLICVNHELGGAEASSYTVRMARGDDTDALIRQACNDSSMKNISQTSRGNPDGWDEILGAEKWANITESQFDRWIEMLSALELTRYNTQIGGVAGQGKAEFNEYAVYAMQLYTWHLTNPIAGKPWYGRYSGGDMSKIQACYEYLVNMVYELYHGEGNVQPSEIKFTTPRSSKVRTYTTETDAKEHSIGGFVEVDDSEGNPISKTDTQTFYIDNDYLDEWEQIKYVVIDGHIERFLENKNIYPQGQNDNNHVFYIMKNANSFTVYKDPKDDTDYTVEFRATPDGAEEKEAMDSWAMFGKPNVDKQRIFTAFKSPMVSGTPMFITFSSVNIGTTAPDDPVFPYFVVNVEKVDEDVGNDRDEHTSMGDGDLSATFEVTWNTDCGDSGREVLTTDENGYASTDVIMPWGKMYFKDNPTVNVDTETKTYTDPDNPDVPEVEYDFALTFTGSCDIEVRETGSSVGHNLNTETQTHHIEYYAYTEREEENPEADFKPIEYRITVDGQPTSFDTSDDIMASWYAPYEFEADVFVEDIYDGVLQIIKEIGDDDIFSSDDGQGTTAGGVNPSRQYSKYSQWTIRLADAGSENDPWLHVVEDTAMQNSQVGQLMHCYKVVTNGGGTPADENHPLTIYPGSQFGQIYISGIPYGTYILTEIKADGDRYVTESMYFTVSRDKQVISTNIENTSKKNVVQIVKVDAETGKTIPSSATAFRIRYMGSPEYDDPTQTPNYGRYLPNATNINASASSANDYIFYTDDAGKITIPYELEYGIYQLEEILVPEGYYVGTYGTDGVATTAPGGADYYGEDDDNHQTSGPSDMSFGTRVAIYNDNGEPIDYTTDENVAFNYYTFEVTKQNAHLDGEGYQAYYLTVEIRNTSAKGRIQIFKLGEKLVGFTETTDSYGNVIYQPVYESYPLPGAKFGIYAAQDILLEDGEEPPAAYDKLTDEEIQLITKSLSHVLSGNQELVKSGVHEPSGAEIIYSIERGQSETNNNRLDYITPAQRNTTYSFKCSRYDEEKGITYEYDVTFDFEYTAGGWNYTNVHVERTLTADDYVVGIDSELPKLYNGTEEVEFSYSQEFANGNRLEVNEFEDDYDLSANHFVPEEFRETSLPFRPEITEPDNPDSLMFMPEIPDGYELYMITENEIVIRTIDKPYTYMAAKQNADGEFDSWVKTSELANADRFIPKYKEEVVNNIPALPDGVVYAYATLTELYVTVHETIVDENTGDETQVERIKIVYQNESGDLEFYDPDNIPDLLGNRPTDVPEGYEWEKQDGVIRASKIDEATGEKLYMVRVYDEDLGDFRWIPSNEYGEAYKVRRQIFDFTFGQYARSEDGVRFEMDGLVLTNMAESEEKAVANVHNPFDVEPTIAESIGCEVNVDGEDTEIIIRHPQAPVYFKLMDGTEVETVYLGGFTKTTITVSSEDEYPDIYYGGSKVDYLDKANGGLSPSNNSAEVRVNDYNYIVTTRHEPDDKHNVPYITIEIISNATGKANAFVVDYHGRYQSYTVTVYDDEAEAERGELIFTSVYKTMRYPVSKLVETITSDADGIATSSILPLGNYIIREIEAPDGYVRSNLSYPFALSYRDQYTPLVWATGEIDNSAISVQLDLYKEFQKDPNGSEYEPRAGAVFGIYSYNGIRHTADASDPDSISTPDVGEGTLIATVTTDEDGRAIETVKLPVGDYYVQEIATLDGYELNRTRFMFRVSDTAKSSKLEFAYEEDGILGKVVHSGYKTAEITITTLVQYPMPKLKVNGIEYDLNEALEDKTVGNNALVSNVIDDDRSTFKVTASYNAPVTIEFENGSKLIVEVGETTYKATFVDADGHEVDVTSSITPIVTSEGKEYRFDPTVTATAYLAETSSIYVAPQTVVRSHNGTSVEFDYDMTEGVKKAVIGYSSDYRYYDNEDIPTHGVEYDKGDVNGDGIVNGDDRVIIENAIGGTIELNDNQKKIADMNDDGELNDDDIVLLDEVLNGTRENGKITVQEEYLPEDAITFETEGLGNQGYVGTTNDAIERKLTVDLSKLSTRRTVTIGDAVVILDGDEIGITGEETVVVNKKSGDEVENGRQPDELIVRNKNTLVSTNKKLELSSANNTSAIEMTLNYDHRFATVVITKGVPVSLLVNDVAQSVDYFTANKLAAGNSAIVVFNDGVVFHLELSNTGFARMSAEGFINGNLGDHDTNIPKLKVNGSEDNFQNTDREVIEQSVPMDETSFDEIRQHNTKSVTLARTDSTVKELQVKINASEAPIIDAPANPVPGTTPAAPENPGENRPTPITNDLKPYISKVSATTGKELPGAEIEIYDANGEVIASGFSDENGKFYFEKPEPGTYTFKEITAPAGYQLNVEIFEFVVHPDGTITGDNTIKDYPVPHTPTKPKTYSYTISKEDATNAEGVPGAEIEILNAEKTEVVASGITDENGKFTFTTTKTGTYWFHETVAPNGYVLNEEWFTFTINADGTIVGDDLITDKRTEVTISKVDATNAEGVPGAEIEVLDDSGNVIASGVSDENGEFKFTRPDAGTYYFHEVVAPEGYILNEEWFTFTVNEDNTVTGDDTILNKRTIVIISKVDVTNAEGVPGAKIEVTDENGNVIAEGYSDHDGFFGFVRPDPGIYFFHEVVAPTGYILNEEYFSFTVNEDLTITGDNTITNIPNTVIIQKTDATSKEPLKGAVIEVWDEEGKLIKAGVSDENGVMYFAAPKVGTYIYKEKIAPEGYILDEGTHIITIHPDGTITGEKVLTNTPYIPQTGIADNTALMIGLIVFFTLLGSVTTIALIKRKKKSDN